MEASIGISVLPLEELIIRIINSPKPTVISAQKEWVELTDRFTEEIIEGIEQTYAKYRNPSTARSLKQHDIDVEEFLVDLVVNKDCVRYILFFIIHKFSDMDHFLLRGVLQDVLTGYDGAHDIFRLIAGLAMEKYLAEEGLLEPIRVPLLVRISDWIKFFIMKHQCKRLYWLTGPLRRYAHKRRPKERYRFKDI
ncbi:MAG: hypothetical protein AB1489_25150 [Acidobacteriota bacterium]